MKLYVRLDKNHHLLAIDSPSFNYIISDNNPEWNYFLDDDIVSYEALCQKFIPYGIVDEEGFYNYILASGMIILNPNKDKEKQEKENLPKIPTEQEKINALLLKEIAALKAGVINV